MYDKDHCWQYDIRISNLHEDLIQAGLTLDETKNLKVSDFDFVPVSKTNTQALTEVKRFIERHEWLGTMSLYPSHIFTARYKKNKTKMGKGILAGVVIMDMPAAFSNMLGEDTRKIERLISRGACVSWSPKNLASWLIMESIHWMVKNTQYRLFTAYSDPEAKELGTIYQACNFIYLGATHGTAKRYRYPNTDKWFSDRSFRSRSAYKRYAKNLGIEWQKEWSNGDSVLFDKMPPSVVQSLKSEMRFQYSLCEIKDQPKKHKYCYILGSDKRETKQLKAQFKQNNPKLVGLPYPKTRGK